MIYELMSLAGQKIKTDIWIDGVDGKNWKTDIWIDAQKSGFLQFVIYELMPKNQFHIYEKGKKKLCFNPPPLFFGLRPVSSFRLQSGRAKKPK